MPTAFVARKPRAEPQRESFILKAMLVASALVMAALLLANQEFYFSTPAHSLSEVEVALRLTPN